MDTRKYEGLTFVGMYVYDDPKDGRHHEHELYHGPYIFGIPITCTGCLDRLATQRLELCQKYGWSEWPFVVKEGR